MSDTEPPYRYNENVVVEVLTNAQVEARAKLMGKGANLCCSLECNLIDDSAVRVFLETLFKDHPALAYVKNGSYGLHQLKPKVPSLAIPITKGELAANLAKLGWQEWVHPYVYARAFQPFWRGTIELQGFNEVTNNFLLWPWDQLFDTKYLAELYKPLERFSVEWPQKRSALGLPDYLELETLVVALCSVQPTDLTPRQVNEIVALKWRINDRPREELHAKLSEADTPQGDWYKGYLSTRKCKHADETGFETESGWYTISTAFTPPTSAVPGTSRSCSGSCSNSNASIDSIDGAGSAGSNQSIDGMGSIDSSTSSDNDSGFVVVGRDPPSRM
jgi:hypothetical protein